MASKQKEQCGSRALMPLKAPADFGCSPLIGGALFFARRAWERHAPFLCKLHNSTHFSAKTLCNLTKRNFLKPIDIFSVLWYNIIVVKGTVETQSGQCDSTVPTIPKKF